MQTSDNQSQADKHRLQIEMVMKDSDLKKYQRQKAELELAIRELRKKQTQIEFDLASKTSLFKKTEAEIALLQNEIIKLKRRIAGL